MTTTETEVRAGQIWADNDKRSKGRYVKVLETTGPNAARPSRARVVSCFEDGEWAPTALRARITWIALDRFRPTSTGYRLISDPTLPPSARVSS